MVNSDKALHAVCVKGPHSPHPLPLTRIGEGRNKEQALFYCDFNACVEVMQMFDSSSVQRSRFQR